MKRLKRWMKEMFDPEEFNDLDIFSVAEALNDSELRKRWILDVVDEIRRINMEVDQRLLRGSDYGLTDLCARRKAFQDALEMVLKIKRQAMKQDVRLNPGLGIVNLDRVTA